MTHWRLLMRSVWRPRWAAYALVATFVAGTAGCGTVPTDAGDDLPTMDGSWAFSESLTSQNAAISCERRGTLSFWQDEDVLGGSYTRVTTCAGGAPAPEQSESGQVSEGLVRPSQLEFSIGICRYRGTVDDAAAEQTSGSIFCTSGRLGADGLLESSAGSWQAQRITDADSSS